jgi:hypothetical protein
MPRPLLSEGCRALSLWPSFTRGTIPGALAYVHGNVRSRPGWVVHLVRFEQYVIEEVVASSSYVDLLDHSLLRVEDRRFVYRLFYLPPVGFKPLRVVLGDLSWEAGVS